MLHSPWATICFTSHGLVSSGTKSGRLRTVTVRMFLTRPLTATPLTLRPCSSAKSRSTCAKLGWGTTRHILSGTRLIAPASQSPSRAPSLSGSVLCGPQRRRLPWATYCRVRSTAKYVDEEFERLFGDEIRKMMAEDAAYRAKLPRRRYRIKASDNYDETAWERGNAAAQKVNLRADGEVRHRKAGELQ